MIARKKILRTIAKVAEENFAVFFEREDGKGKSMR
jgi:hypothetical protein